MAMQSTEGKGQRDKFFTFKEIEGSWYVVCGGSDKGMIVAEAAKNREVVELMCEKFNKLYEAYSQSGAGPTRTINDAAKLIKQIEVCEHFPDKIALLADFVRGAGSPEETKPTKCQHGVNYPHECKDCIFAEGYCQLASHSGLHTERDDCMNWWVVARPIGAASSSQSAAPTEPKGEQNGDCVDSSVHFNTGDSPSIGTALSDKKIGDLEQCPSCGSRYKCYFKWPNCHALGKHESWHSSVSKSAPEPPSQPVCTKCGGIIFFHGDGWYHANGADVMKCGVAVPTGGQIANPVAGGGSTGERAEPSEREKFEIWVKGSEFGYELTRSMIRGERTGEYIKNTTYNAWQGWQARAALAEGSRTPTPGRILGEMGPRSFGS